MSDKLSFEQFLEMFDSSLNDEQLAKFQKKLDDLKQQKLDGAIDKIRELIDTYGIPFTAIVEIYDEDSTQVDDFVKQRAGVKITKPEGDTKVYKYVNPKNPKQKWTGTANKPKWFVEAMTEKGVTKPSEMKQFPEYVYPGL